MALVVTVFLVWFAAAVARDRGAPAGMRLGALVLVGLLALQIFLGAEIIRTHRDPVITTGHVLIGALTLAATFWLTLLAHRNRIEA
jgi:cytochrome c oxidase assembly protein subunit 15